MTTQMQCSPAQRSKEDFLTSAIDLLDQRLGAPVSGREREWIEQVGMAVVGVGKGLRRHVNVTDMSNGVFSEVDETRPTLARQAEELCGDSIDLLVSTVFLHDEIQHALEIIRAGSGRNGDAAAVAMPNLEAINQRAERLVADLRQIEEAETKLVLESVYTDLGVGD